MMTLALAPLTSVFLISIRIGVPFFLSPIDAIRCLPASVRILLAFAVSSIIVWSLQSFVAPETLVDDGALILSCLSELMNGLCFSLSVYAAFGAVHLAGQLIDAQTGLNMAAVFNPTDQSSDPWSSRFLWMVMMMLFFACNGHHRVVQTLFLCCAHTPPGHLMLLDGLESMLQPFEGMLTLGFMLAAPMVVCLFTIDLCAAMLSRNMPQINPYFLIVPIKIMLGLFIFYAMIPHLPAFFHRAIPS